MEFQSNQWNSIGIHGIPLKCMEFHWNPSNSIEIQWGFGFCNAFSSSSGTHLVGWHVCGCEQLVTFVVVSWSHLLFTPPSTHCIWPSPDHCVYIICVYHVGAHLCKVLVACRVVVGAEFVSCMQSGCWGRVCVMHAEHVCGCEQLVGHILCCMHHLWQSLCCMQSGCWGKVCVMHAEHVCGCEQLVAFVVVSRGFYILTCEQLVTFVVYPTFRALYLAFSRPVCVYHLCVSFWSPFVLSACCMQSACCGRVCVMHAEWECRVCVHNACERWHFALQGAAERQSSWHIALQVCIQMQFWVLQIHMWAVGRICCWPPPSMHCIWPSADHCVYTICVSHFDAHLC